ENRLQRKRRRLLLLRHVARQLHPLFLRLPPPGPLRLSTTRERRLQSHPHRPVRDDQHPRRRYLHRQVAPQAPEQAVSRRPFPESLRSHRQTGHHQRAAGPNKRAPLMKTRTSMALLLFAATTAFAEPHVRHASTATPRELYATQRLEQAVR